jgi:hypothetical protein
MNWLSKYKNKLGVRFNTFEMLFKLAYERNLKNTIETGTARGKEKFYYLKPRINWKDGMSTVLFSEYNKDINGLFWSCDIDNKNIYNASNFIKNLNYKVNFVVSDSHDFLRNCSMIIDILYLDSLDGNMPKANEHQLIEAQLASINMNDNGLIILDDKGSKTELSIPFLKSKGWKIILENEQQVLFSK